MSPRKKKASSLPKEISSRTVIDATEPLQLRILTSDILDATPGDPSKCAVALACKRLVVGADEVLIHRSRAYVRKGEVWTRYQVPESIQREIIAFDRGAEFVPGNYELGPIQLSQRLGERQGSDAESRSGKHASKKIRRAPIHYTKDIRPNMVSGNAMHTKLGA